MIPERDDFHSVPRRADAAAPASGANQLLKLWRVDSAHDDDDNSPAPNAADHRTAASLQQSTAWSRYLCYVEAMRSQGQKFDQKYVLEAMFRGKDLVYRSNSAPIATADCASA